VNHWRAQDLLPSVLDHTLPAPLEAAVREHVSGCASCGKALAEHQAAERLLGHLPASLLSMDPAAGAERRLTALARWAAVPELSLPERLGVAALGSAAAAAMLAMVVMLQRWDPPAEAVNAPVSMAAVLPDAQLTMMGSLR